MTASIEALSVTATEATVEFTLTDAAGTALDRTGRLTQGAVAVGFVLAQLPQLADGSPGQYLAYTGTAGPESTGTFTPLNVEQGRYRYRFAAPLTGFNPDRTQTVLAVAERTRDGHLARARRLHSTVPTGGTPAERERVTEAKCASCHGAAPLSGHEGRYQGSGQCVLCHTSGQVDGETANSLDWRVMVHKIHRGRELPSVRAGAPYTFVDPASVLKDFSAARYPRRLNDCTSCHAGAQGDRWKTAAEVETCTSCHDLTSFADSPPPPLTPHGGGTGAGFGPGSCAICHTGPAVEAAHLTGLLAADAPQWTAELESITNSGPGQAPVVTFRILRGGAPHDLLAQPLTNLFANFAGPNTDFGSLQTARIQGGGAQGTLIAVDANAGRFSYTFPSATVVPPTATGSYTLSLEGSEVLASGVRHPLKCSPLVFAVTAPAPVARRTIVAAASCNACHGELYGHNDARVGLENCLLCHNPTLTNAGRVSRFEGSVVLAESLDFRVMIHKVHMGDALSQPYTLGTSPVPVSYNPGGTQVDHGGNRYPRNRADCSACHQEASWTLPMVASPAYLPSRTEELTCTEDVAPDPDDYCDTRTSEVTLLFPETAACISCHDAPYVGTHAALNTAPGGAESCATCHGAGSQWEVTAVHRAEAGE